ncbi:MAG: glycosyltransferase family 2 protein [Armatimonadetes bacterium]|nr:glycosyltransferase family 2 protein [Armatimonadota bacterium]
MRNDVADNPRAMDTVQPDEGLRRLAPAISVVVPVFNEEALIAELHERLTSVLLGIGRSYEIVIVDDGSRDASLERLAALAAVDPCLRVLGFSRNFGHHIAISAGLDYCRGEYVIVMDGDLQHRPEDIPRFVAALEEGGYDVVAGVRRPVQVSWFKRQTSRVFNGLMRRTIRENIHIDSNIFRIMRRKVVRSFNRCREHSRFVTGLFGWVGFKRGEIEIELDARRAGASKYSLLRMIRLAVNSMTAFSYFPLELCSYTGCVMASLSFTYGFYLILRKLFLNTAVEGWTSLTCTVFFVGGIQMLMLGVIGSYLGRVYTEVQNRPLYIIDQALNCDE